MLLKRIPGIRTGGKLLSNSFLLCAIVRSWGQYFLYCALEQATHQSDWPFQVVLIAGGAAGGRQIQKQIRNAQKEQARLCTDVQDSRRKGKKKEKVAVDRVFYERLLRILKM